MLLPQRVHSPLLPDPLQPPLWCPHHCHAGQPDLRLVSGDQGNGDTGSDRDGSTRGLDGAARWCHDPQLQLQWGVNHCRALRTAGRVDQVPDLFPDKPPRGWGVWLRLCHLGAQRLKKTGVAYQTLQNCVQPLCAHTKECLLCSAFLSPQSSGSISNPDSLQQSPCIKYPSPCWTPFCQLLCCFSYSGGIRLASH